jgi:uncharacterized protein (TIGR03083 family)
VDAANARSVEQRAAIPVQQLLAELEEIIAVRGVARLFAGLLLVDNWTHHEDVRRPLGRPREQDPDRLRWVLRWARLVPYSRGKGLRLVATDLDFASGRGPEVRGPGADLIMAISGRSMATRHLDGPGLGYLLP